MQRKAFTAAVLAASVGMSGVAMAAMDSEMKPKVYGQLHVALEDYDYENDTGSNLDYDQFRVESYKSRLGVKGKLPISEGFAGIYKVEWEVAVDDGNFGGSNDGDVFKAREMFGGFETPFGTILMGKHDTPLKDSQGKIDLFNDTQADVGHTLNGSKTISGEERPSNVIGYISPKVAETLEFRLFAIQGEEGRCDDAADDCDDSIGDGISASVVFGQENMHIGLGYDNGVEGDGGNYLSLTTPAENIDYDRIRATFGLDLEFLRLGVLAQVAELNSDSESELERRGGGAGYTDPVSDETSFMVSVGIPVGDILFKAQYAMAEYEEEQNSTTKRDHDRTGEAGGHGERPRPSGSSARSRHAEPRGPNGHHRSA